MTSRSGEWWKTGRLSSLLVVAVATLLVGACAGGGEEREPTGGDTVASPTATSGQPSPDEQKGGGTLIVASTLSDIPSTGGQSTQGHEGFRFVGFNLSDGLTRWDLTRDDVYADVVPGLAESWEISGADLTKWIWHLRRGVKFHDGTDYDADAAIWIFDRIKESASRGKAPHFDEQQAANVRLFASTLKDWRKIDDFTIEIETAWVNSFLPWTASFYLSVSPTRYTELGPDDYPNNPAGTGPWKFEKLVPRERLEMVRNEDYWGKVPNADRMIILPMPDPGSRLAALRTGRVNWIEVPPADAVPGLRRDGFQIFLNQTPHVWHWTPLFTRPPFNDKNIRYALNYAIDRETLCRDVMAGTCIPAISHMYPTHPWFGDPPFRPTYDPEKSCELVRAAGYDRISFTVLTTPSGSGQMLPVQMHEFLQSSVERGCFDMDMIYVDWATRGAYFREHQWDTYDINQSAWAPQDPFAAFSRVFHTRSHYPAGGNGGIYTNLEVDAAIEKAEASFDAAERTRWLIRTHELLNEDAAIIWIAHDLNPRVLAPNVKGYVHPQSWFTDNSLPWVETR